MYKYLNLIVFLACLPLTILGQGNIDFVNGSFEDSPANSKAPKGWNDCGMIGETPPDVHPGGFFGVISPAQHGSTYMGMVTRNDDTWESVTQRISGNILKGKCYKFSIYLKRSMRYISHNRKTGSEQNYTNAIKLRVWAGDAVCDKKELLAETPLIKNSNWEEYVIKFNPKRGSYQYIVFEAYYKTPTLVPYNGNILMDNASQIVRCDKDIPKSEPIEDKVIALNIPKKTKPINEKPKKTIPKKTIPPKTPKTDKKPTTSPEKKEPIMDLDKRKLKKGETLRIDNLYFDTDSSHITKESMPVLEEIALYLQGHTKIIIEIGGHTSGLCDAKFCDVLSKDRAKSVAEYIVDSGVDGNRVFYHGYGKRKPISSNRTKYGRERNQRVEVKILSIDGEFNN